MESRESKQTDPLQNLFTDIKKILDFMEVKDQVAANEAETETSKSQSVRWIAAILKNDTYTSYKEYWDLSMFQEVMPNIKYNVVRYFMSNPSNVYLEFQDTLLERGRERFLAEFVETNNYYRSLMGLPDYESNDFIYLSETLAKEFGTSSDIPIHLLSPSIQNRYMSTDEYKEVLLNNPDKKYLTHLGTYKVDLFTARRAKDFEIIRYPVNRSDINPNLLNKFITTYSDYREYVMVALYNENLASLYDNYRTFMRLIIQMFTLMQTCNNATESTINHEYLDDNMIHILLSTYGLSDSIILTKDIRRNLATNILKLTREKGTDDVYYDLIKILGYQDIIVSKLMLMKGQNFTKSAKSTDSIEYDPYFLKVDIKDNSIYDTISSGNAQRYSYHDIIDNDPTWWDLPDTRKILTESNYTISNSKYIMIEAVINQMKYMFESIYFPRMILDNRKYTDDFKISIPELFGTKMISVYDLVVFIITANCMMTGLSGEIISNEMDLIATAGFNFNININQFMEYLDTTKYADKNKIKSFIENITMNDISDIDRIFNDILYPMREWLELKISKTDNKDEYIEYESIYRALYTYDINNNPFLEDWEMPIQSIRKDHNLSEDDLIAYQHFYPRTLTGEKITISDYDSSRYSSPFLSKINEVDWYIHITLETTRGEDDRGYLYFHDILNCDDIRELTNPNGTRIFMDYISEEEGWKLNQNAIDRAIYLIDHLDDNALNQAYFQQDTPVLGKNKTFKKNEKLPSSLKYGVYKEILKEKIMMDCRGFSNPPTTYQEYLYRKNEELYDILVKNNRFETNPDAWYNDIMVVLTSMENELNVHMKYFEQSIIGSDLFFKPLITLINHFKSSFVQVNRTGLKYIFTDKMDAGGNSNMLKVFDEVSFVIHFVTLQNRGYVSQLGFFDTEHSAKYGIIMKDRSEILRMIPSGFDVNVRESRMGSMHIVDEMKFFKNGKNIDPSGDVSSWYSGEPGTGRWAEEDDVLMMARKNNTHVKNNPVDLDGWKDYVESYSPI